MTRALEEVGADADDLLRTAHEAAYRLPSGFGGFAAAIRCSEGGQWAEGTVRAWRPGDVEVDLDGDPFSSSYRVAGGGGRG